MVLTPDRLVDIHTRQCLCATVVRYTLWVVGIRELQAAPRCSLVCLICHGMFMSPLIAPCLEDLCKCVCAIISCRHPRHRVSALSRVRQLSKHFLSPHNIVCVHVHTVFVVAQGIKPALPFAAPQPVIVYDAPLV
ncbi:hypothetical protein ORF014L [Spotted knifejaw iridovirus]|nr:hypothetical protein ORF014L [Spotted knifejaw iridovirus]